MNKFIKRAKILMTRLDAFASMCPDNISEDYWEIVAEIYLLDSLDDYRACVLEAQTLLYETEITHLYRESVRKNLPGPRQLCRLLELAVRDREPRHDSE